jgi:uncharacterized membrane protein
MEIWLALIAALGFAVGNVLQKSGLDRLPKVKPLWLEMLSSGLWWLGLGVTSVAVLLGYAATALGQLSLVQPILSLNPLLSVALAAWWLRERLDSWSKIALVAFLLGLICLVWVKGEAQWVDPSLMWKTGLALFLLMLIGSFLPLSPAWKWSIVSGLGFALSPVLFKAAAFTQSLAVDGGASLWQSWLFQPYTGAFVAIYLINFVVSQVALAAGKLHFVVPLSAGIGMVGASATGIYAFGEGLDLGKWLGLMAMTLAFVAFARSRNT